MMEKKKKAAKRRYVPRQTRKFQLRLEHSTDRHVGEILNYARTQRREVTVIRDGVRLLWALENNDLSVLFELFPHLKEQFMPSGLNLIEQFQAMLLQTHVPAVNRPVVEQAMPAPVGLKQLATSKLDLPVFDDDADTLIITKNYDSSSSTNFVNMMKNLQ